MPGTEFFSRMIKEQFVRGPRSVEDFYLMQAGVINQEVTSYAHELLGDGERSVLSRVQGFFVSGTVSREQFQTQTDGRFDRRIYTTIQLMVNNAHKKGYIPPDTPILQERERIKRKLEVTTCEALIQKAIQETTISPRLRASAWRLISQNGNKLRYDHPDFPIDRRLMRDIQAGLLRAQDATELAELFDRYQEVVLNGEMSED